jgi:hypothetical protein
VESPALPGAALLSEEGDEVGDASGGGVGDLKLEAGGSVSSTTVAFVLVGVLL